MASINDRIEHKGCNRPNLRTNRKNACRGRLSLHRVGNWLCGLGIFLFLACPYIHHAFVEWCEGEPGEGFYAVTGPLFIFFAAFWLYNKGEKLRED